MDDDFDPLLHPDRAEAAAATDRLHALAHLAETLREAPEVSKDDHGEAALQAWHGALEALYRAVARAVASA